MHLVQIKKNNSINFLKASSVLFQCPAICPPGPPGPPGMPGFKVNDQILCTILFVLLTTNSLEQIPIIIAFNWSFYNLLGTHRTQRRKRRIRERWRKGNIRAWLDTYSVCPLIYLIRWYKYWLYILDDAVFYRVCNISVSSVQGEQGPPGPPGLPGTVGLQVSDPFYRFCSHIMLISATDINISLIFMSQYSVEKCICLLICVICINLHIKCHHINGPRKLWGDTRTLAWC